MSAVYENVVVEEAVPAKEAVIKKVMVLKIDQGTKTVFDQARKFSFINWVGYPAMLFFLWWLFFHFDVLGELSQECSHYYHGECDDGAGLATLILPVIITLILMTPAVWGSLTRFQMKALLLKKAGWDGTSEYRLEVEK